MGNLIRLHGRHLVGGAATGSAIVSSVPLSFLGGYDPESGRIIDQRHPLAGTSAANRVLVIPSGRGSCSGSGVLLEAIKNGTAPAAIIISRVDPIITLGAILGEELIRVTVPVVVVDEPERQRIATGNMVTLDSLGVVTIARATGNATKRTSR